MNETFLLPIFGFSVAMFAAAIAIVFIKLKNEQDKRKSDLSVKADLSYMREQLERKIKDISEQMVSNDEKWKEVNHLLLSYNPVINKEYGVSTAPILSNFFLDMGIETANIDIKEDLVFVLTPFLNDYYATFRSIKQACNSMNLKCMKGDEEFIRGNVFKYILEKIISARVIIANIDGRNPNVMYELGIAQAIGKPTILVSKNLTEVPFDLKSNYIILYQRDEELIYLLVSMLKKLLNK